MIESTAYNRISDSSHDAKNLLESWARIWKALDSGKDGEKEIKAHVALVGGLYHRNPAAIERETRERILKVGPKTRVKYLRQCQVAVGSRRSDAD